MDSTVLRMARSVLLPAFADLDLHESTWEFLEGGGRAVLLGETREEYVRREMDDDRVGRETSDAFVELVARIESSAGRPALIAVDQELAGIQRLHRLVRPLPTRAQANLWTFDQIAEACRTTSADIAALGVNLVLSPVVDLPTAFSPWLHRRVMADDLGSVSRIAAAYVRGMQASGRVAATAKHFPGHASVPADPALDITAGERTEEHLAPFVAAIEANVACVMVGPVAVPALDHEPSSTSARTVRKLRQELSFGGLIISDDLDEPSIARGRTVPDTAVAALSAGVDLLLVAGGQQVETIASQIAAAVSAGELHGARVEEAAQRIDDVCSRVSHAR